jgi:hypothetical protein
MHPALILLVGLICEAAVQFSKRAVYWVDSVGTTIHYGALLAGDIVFVCLFAIMVSYLSLRRRHLVLVVLFVCTLTYTLMLSGLAATIVAVRNTYLWILLTLVFALSAKQPIGAAPARSLVGATQFLAVSLTLFAIIQIQSDYAFEKPWFEFSGTSLNYDGVTNFGQASKAFSMMSGPTDFACFGLFALAVGIATRTWTLNLLGAAIVAMSGTRGILIAIPIWILLTWVSAVHIRRNYYILITTCFGLIVLFSDGLINLLYALPNSRFSLATLAPRIELWMSLEPTGFITGRGFAANLSPENLANAPTVLDSGLIYLLTEIGGPLTLGLLYVLLSAARRDLLDSRSGVLQLFIGVLLIASIVQIPFHTRLSNFLVCLLVYSGIYHAKTVQIRKLGR